METQKLEQLGLSKGEAIIYLSLLELGSVPSGSVVKHTGFRKSTVYETINRLIEKGLVSYVIKNNIKQFEAANPEKILDYIDAKKRKLITEGETAKELITQLKEGFTILRPQAEAQVLVGVEGFKTMRRDILRHSKGELMLLGAVSIENEVLGDFFGWWNKERQKKKINLRILHKESARGKPMTQNSFMGKYFENRFLAKDIESPAVVNIYGDRVVNLVWKNNQPICFLLINQDIADSYRKYFEYLWKISTS